MIEHVVLPPKASPLLTRATWKVAIVPRPPCVELSYMPGEMMQVDEHPMQAFARLTWAEELLAVWHRY